MVMAAMIMYNEEQRVGSSSSGQQPGLAGVGAGGLLPRRPRSPSPFLSSARGQRSLSAVGLRDASKSNLSPISRESIRALSPTDHRPQTSNPSRKKTATHASNKTRRRTPDPTALSSNHRESISKMSAELPPIGGSSTNISSRRSSQNSVNSRTVQRNHDNATTRVLITVDTRPEVSHTPTTARQQSDPLPGKRSHLSPGSQTTGSSSPSGAHNGGSGLTRSKTWSAELASGGGGGGGASVKPQLETLVEQKVSGSTPAPGNTMRQTAAQRPGMTRNHSNNSLSTMQQNALNPAKRTKSYTNLTAKTSEGSRNNISPFTNNKQKTNLTRYQSDTSLNRQSTTPRAFTTHKPRQTTTSKLRTAKAAAVAGSSTDHHAMTNGHHHNNHNHSSSSNQKDKDVTLNSVNLNRGGSNDDELAAEECEMNDRIIQWLIGVDSAGTEDVPHQEIIEDEPAQTDTAIHIVYDGD